MARDYRVEGVTLYEKDGINLGSRGTADVRAKQHGNSGRTDRNEWIRGGADRNGADRNQGDAQRPERNDGPERDDWYRSERDVGYRNEHFREHGPSERHRDRHRYRQCEPDEEEQVETQQEQERFDDGLGKHGLRVGIDGTLSNTGRPIFRPPHF